MWSQISETSRYFTRFYCRAAVDFWENLSPSQYGGLLIGVGIVGWFLMRSANQR